MAFTEKLRNIQAEFGEDLASCRDTAALEGLKVKFLGRKGMLTGVLRSLSDLAPEERKETGKKANALRAEFARQIEELRASFTERDVPSSGEADITMPGIAPPRGGLHPLTLAMERINDIFISLGFSIAEGPEIETEFHNFEALNIPADHPSRDAFDTFYIEGRHLLRSHTSNVQIHVMRESSPPLQVIMPGRVYRPDAVDASHSFMFHQVEGLMVDRSVNFAELKGVLSVFCRSMFGEGIKTRLRPHFFPFTEPSAEVDISCIICAGKGCRVCKGSGWLEILGAGMVHPRVFEAVGYVAGKYTGFAFGMGVERIAMLLYGIEDIRIFYENDIRFLRQF